MKLRVFLAIIFVFLAGWLLYTYSPEEYAWFSKCPFLLLSGYQCPACGVQRAFHAFLHGEFCKSLSYNPFFVISVPYAILVLATKIPKFKVLKKVVFHKTVVYGYVALFCAWWVIRNL